MNDSLDLVSVGSATIDIFLKIHDENLQCRLDKGTSELCFKFGEKIQLDDYQFLFGGNGCNVAVGASRLDLKTAFIAELGDDDLSQRIIDYLFQEKVDSSLIKKTPGKKSSIAIALNFQNERTLFVDHVLRDHDFSLKGIKTQWVFLTSIGKEWQKAYQKVLSYVQENKVKLAFNPGTPQFADGVESFIEIIKKTEILFVNRTEAIRIVNSKLKIENSNGKWRMENGKLETNKAKNLLTTLKEFGSKIVVMTDGKEGSYVIDENGKIYQMGIYPTEVIQKTGAGDAYTSGFLSAIIKSLPIQEAMEWGTANAAGVVTKIGAQTGLLSEKEIREKIERNRGVEI